MLAKLISKSPQKLLIEDYARIIPILEDLLKTFLGVADVSIMIELSDDDE